MRGYRGGAMRSAAGKLLILLSFVWGAVNVLFAQTLVPDSSDIRKELRETWFEAPLSSVRENRTEVRTAKGGNRFQIRLEETDTTFSVVVAPRTEMPVDVYSESGKTTAMQDVYSSSAPGAWLLIRNKRSGNPICVRYYFAPDSGVYVQFSPHGKSAYGDFVIFGNYCARQVPTGLPFERFYAMPFTDVVNLTKHTLPWRYTVRQEGAYDTTLSMIRVIRSRLANLIYADDAMYDENGNPVSILTGAPRRMHAEDAGKMSLSSAGFVKWIADGIVYPMTSGGLKRRPLLEPTVSCDPVGFQGIVSEQYNISFALDWTRNLAAAVFSVATGKTYRYPESGVDMTEDPFAAEMTADGIKNTVGYVKDSGYPASALASLLYVFAAEYPGECYLAAIRETDRKRIPEVHAFNQCAIFFPYFDDAGKFQCAVFRNDAESTLGEFSRTFRSDFIHLVRMRTTATFNPQ